MPLFDSIDAVDDVLAGIDTDAEVWRDEIFGPVLVAVPFDTDDEAIEVHLVPRADVPAFVAAKRAAGVAIDVKMLLLLAGDVLGD